MSIQGFFFVVYGRCINIFNLILDNDIYYLQMIGYLFSHIANKLEEYLKGYYEVTENLVVLGIPSQEGSNELINRISLSVFNVEREDAAGFSGGYRRDDTLRMPVWYLNIYMMVAVCMEDGQYLKSLRLLSDTLSFFQQYSVFETKGGNKYTVEPVSLSLQELTNVWSILGGRYYPSMAYKIRVLVVDGTDVKKTISRIVKTE